jgi:hypothetical protein
MPGCRLDQSRFTAATRTDDVHQQPGTWFGVDLVAQCARLCGYARTVIRRGLRHLPAYPEAVPSEPFRLPVMAGHEAQAAHATPRRRDGKNTPTPGEIR